MICTDLGWQVAFCFHDVGHPFTIMTSDVTASLQLSMPQTIVAQPAQLLKAKLHAMALNTPFAECQRAKIAVNNTQQLLGLWQAQGHMTNPKILHVMAALQVLIYIPFACNTTSCNVVTLA